MKPLHAAGAIVFTVILYSFTGLRGNVDTCKWFDDNLNADRSVGTMTEQTNLLFNRVALPPDAPVTVRGTAVTNEGGSLVDFDLSGATICATAEAVYGPTPSPSPAP